jgi:1,4-dihydroxy-2-naphthoate octaprenyltransferase
VVLLYTAPPVRLNYRGFGETSLFFAFGPMITFGVYYVLVRQPAWEPVLVGVPLGIFTMNIGLVSNTFDHDDDVRSGKRTLALRLGQAAAVRLLAALSAAAYGALGLGVLAGVLTPWSLLALLGAPLAVDTVRRTARFADATHYTAAMTSAIALSSVTGVLLGVAYGIAIFAS